MPPSSSLVLSLLLHLFVFRCLGLLPAQVQQIVLTADIQLQAHNWQRSDPSRPAVAANRNITLSSEPPYRTLDFAFLGSGWLKMAPNTHLNFSQLVVKQSRCATCGHETACGCLPRAHHPIVSDFAGLS